MLQHAAAVHAPGSTTTYTKVTVAATVAQKMPPATKFAPAIPSGTNHRKSYKCCLGHGDAKERLPYAHNGIKALTRHSHSSTKHWELVLAASSRSAQAKSQHAEGLV